MTQAQTETKKRRERSPSYPAIDLEKALDRTRELREKEGRHFAPVGAVVQHWGYTTKSSGGIVTLAALRKFGLIDEQGSGENRQVRPSSLALKILLDERPDSRERSAALQEAALSPAIHAELWQQYEGSLPSSQNLSHELRLKRGFTDTAAAELIEEFRRTIAFARLAESDTMSGQGEDKAKGEDEHRMAPSPSHDTKQQQHPVLPEPALRTIQLPLSIDQWATLAAPFPITDLAWTQMIAVLDAMKPALVSATPPAMKPKETDAKRQLNAEAEDILKTIEDGGVPAFMTPNLKRIAEENGVSVSDDETPNEIIARLRALG